MALTLVFVLLLSVAPVQALAVGNGAQNTGSEQAGDPPAVPDKYGKNVTKKLIRIVCDSDHDHAPMDSELRYVSRTTRYVPDSMVWDQELGAWTAEMILGKNNDIDWHYVYHYFSKNYNNIKHTPVPNKPLPQNYGDFIVKLKWDPAQNLWVTMDDKPEEIHVTCQTAPEAPNVSTLDSLQIKVLGMVDGVQKEYNYGLNKITCTTSEVKGSRKDGFHADVTVNLADNAAIVQDWMKRYTNGAEYGFDLSRTAETLTFTLDYVGDTTGDFRGGKWVYNGKTFGNIATTYVARVATVSYYPITESGNFSDTSSASSKVTEGGKVTELPDVTNPEIGGARKGYHALGWYYLDQDGKKQVFDENTVVTQDMKVFADFAMDTYRVDFVVDGQQTKSVEKLFGSTLAEKDFPEAPVKPGYTFGGWFTEDDKEFTKDWVIEGNLQLHPVFTANKYVVKFNANEGKVDTSSMEIVFDTSVGKLPVPTREGYKFAGWFDAEGNQITDDMLYTIPANAELKAKWVKTADPDAGTDPETPTKPEENTKPEGETKPGETVKPDNKPDSKPGANTKPSGNSQNSQTSDGTNIMMIGSVMVLSIAVMAICVAAKKFRFVKR